MCRASCVVWRFCHVRDRHIFASACAARVASSLRSRQSRQSRFASACAARVASVGNHISDIRFCPLPQHVPRELRLNFKITDNRDGVFASACAARVASIHQQDYRYNVWLCLSMCRASCVDSAAAIILRRKALPQHVPRELRRQPCRRAQYRSCFASACAARVASWKPGR